MKRKSFVKPTIDDDDGNTPGQLDNPFKLPIAQQAQVARTLGESDDQTQSPGRSSALPAGRSETGNGASRSQGNQQRDHGGKCPAARQRLNAARQPILHEALEQDRLVRPRLLARSAPPAKASAKGGTKE